MSAIINPALVAARAYVRPTHAPVRTGFTIGVEDATSKPRVASGATPVQDRRLAPAVEINLSPEALKLLADARNASISHDTGSTASNGGQEAGGNAAVFADHLSGLTDKIPFEPLKARVDSAGHQSAPPGSHIDIVL